MVRRGVKKKKKTSTGLFVCKRSTSQTKKTTDGERGGNGEGRGYHVNLGVKKNMFMANAIRKEQGRKDQPANKKEGRGKETGGEN